MYVHHHSIKKAPRYWRHFWWFRNAEEGDIAHGEIRVECKLFCKGHGIGASLKVDTAEVKLAFYAGSLFTLWLHVESWRHLRRLTERMIGKEYPRDRELSATVREGLVSVTLWRPANHHRRGDRRNILWNWRRAATGRQVTRRVEKSRHSTVVLMPEGTYGAEVILSDVRHEWPRFKRPKTYQTAEIKVEGGIPEPGKGENSWDIDDDATFGLSMGVKGDDSECVEQVGPFRAQGRGVGGVSHGSNVSPCTDVLPILTVSARDPIGPGTPRPSGPPAGARSRRDRSRSPPCR